MGLPQGVDIGSQDLLRHLGKGVFPAYIAFNLSQTLLAFIQAQ